MSTVVLIEGPVKARSRLFTGRARGRVDFITLPVTVDESSLAEGCRGAEIIVIAPGARLPVFQPGHMPRLVQLLDCANETVDPLALGAQGVIVANVSAAVATHVAEFTVGLIKNAAANLNHGGKPTPPDQTVRMAQDASSLASLRGKTIGIIGLGRVGEQVALLLKPHGAHIAYADIRMAPQGLAARLGLRRITSDRLLATSDIITLHLSHGPTASPFLCPRELALIGPATGLVSTSDARVIDLPALAEATSRGSPPVIGLDIAPASEAANRGGIEKLRSLPNAIITDDASSSSPEADGAAVELALGNVERTLLGQPAQSIMETIDFPKTGDPAFWASRLFPRQT
ncbi:MAG: hypothetical protein EXR44_02505 [Dehalococcoidia bacterium]|nr:hypothetical protein [Dehalococcoidia bacterium]